jgi:hypothetical protein
MHPLAVQADKMSAILAAVFPDAMLHTEQICIGAIEAFA